MNRKAVLLILTVLLMLGGACKKTAPGENNVTTDSLMVKLNDFSVFRLTTDLSVLTGKEKQMIPLLIEAARLMDDIFWMEAWGDKDKLLDSLDSDEAKKLVIINYGPWERLNNNQPFLPGYGPKPPGANFYPPDMTADEFNNLSAPDKTSLYTLIRRDEAGNLITIPYHEAFREQVTKASGLLKQASTLAEDPGLKKYLALRAEALHTDDYYPSDIAWMEMKTNTLDFVIGPIETYEDQLYGYKAAHEAYVLVKDKTWTRRLARYATLLPKLQQSLPVDAKYKQEMPGSESDLGAYDAIYYAGDCNAGSKTIAINLPNDEKVQLAKGSRRLQLKNSMQAKFDRILVPIAQQLIEKDHLDHVTFDAFFSHTMFHEMAHGLGPIRNTLTGKGTVREALKEKYTTLEEGKADIVGLFLVDRLMEMGELDTDLMDEYTTFLASIFRSIRFGASSAHGKANLIFFNYFKENGAFTVSDSGKFSVQPDAMKAAIHSLSNLILTIQGDGDYERASALISQYAVMSDTLKAALKKVEEQDIPVDIVFEQGTAVLGLQ
jgi:hypothetical protein